MIKAVRVICCLAILLLNSVVIAQTDTRSEYRINRGDVLQISVYQEDDMDKTVQVASDGSIAYPLIGNLAVAGLTPKEVEEKMVKLLGEDYLVNPQVNVFVKEYVKIFVMGQVKKPGSFELKPGLTVLGAIAMAEGLTDIAAPDQTKIIRDRNGKKEAINVPVGSLLKGGDRSKDVPLEPNDTVMVPESFF